MASGSNYVVPLARVSMEDVARVGGKNASLGEMIANLRESGIAVPEGFATTAQAYWDFLDANAMREKLAQKLAALEGDPSALARVGKEVRRLFLQAQFPPALATAITGAYKQMGNGGIRLPDVAVRSSATAEDLPKASFAGQLETFLNVRGTEELLAACRRCYASLFTDRAIIYRQNHGFDHLKVALSIGVQRMVRSDKAGAGVMFSIDTETGFSDAVLINASWGLGETVVKGEVDPDEYMAFKPLLREGGWRPIIERRCGTKEKKLVYGDGNGTSTRTVITGEPERSRFVLSEEEILTLARWAVSIEEHYRRPMDIEWAKDGMTGQLWVVQARPETVQSRRVADVFKRYELRQKGERLVSGLSIGDAIAAGRVCRLNSPAEIGKFIDGGILVTAVTDPDWGPIMKRAAAIVTDHGGRTSHAAIVSRELGLPAIIGTGNATEVLHEGQEVTVSCAEGDEGFVYSGIADYEVQELSLDQVPQTRTKVMLNVANPAAALRWWPLPADGIGLARMEFIINNVIKIHPMALLQFDKLKDHEAKVEIERLTRTHENKADYFVDNLGYGIARIAASQYPRPVVVRMSDFKTNEYGQLIGGRAFEPWEENPMLGWRGASRYYSEGYRPGFALECRALKRVRDEMGLRNVIVMIPFCRTPAEADRVLEVMAEEGLERGENGLEVYVMCEIPSNVVLAHAFAERFDGFSIGSNDLTQLVLGVDRDSERLAGLFDEQDEAVKEMIRTVIEKAHKGNRKVGLCGQAPSDYPQFARFLVEAGIDSISVSPDSFLAVKQEVKKAEGK